MPDNLTPWTVETLTAHYARCVHRITDDHNFEVDAREACITRSTLEESRASWTAEQAANIQATDDLLQRRYERVVEAELFASGQPRSHWWWYLAEGPQVRNQAARIPTSA